MLQADYFAQNDANQGRPLGRPSHWIRLLSISKMVYLDHLEEEDCHTSLHSDPYIPTFHFDAARWDRHF